MKKIYILSILCAASSVLAGQYLPQNGELYEQSADGTIISFGAAAGQSGSVAIAMDSSKFVGWASGYKNLVYGTAGNPVVDQWKTPEKALGVATGGYGDILCLGDGGTITLTFDTPIGNGDGNDFAVFENAFGDGALELAYVEVSTDGEHFVRFPNMYIGEVAMGPYDNLCCALDVYNIGSKYTGQYGNGYDLAELEAAYNYIVNTPLSDGSFSQTYRDEFLANYTYLNLDSINYVKIIDVIGDGTDKDSTGHNIYDPSGCFGSPGFDLQAVGVINSGVIPEAGQVSLFTSLAALMVLVLKRRSLF